ncbi:MAG: hypothetical protein AB7V27_01715 [Candidatus Binatia bacterium]
MADDKPRREVLWSGDNPLIVLKSGPGQPDATAVSFFRVDFSPAGSGHAAFILTELAGGPGRINACYTDRAALGTWLRDTVMVTLPEFQQHDVRAAVVKPARFASLGDTRSSWTELLSTDDGEIRLTWSGLERPFKIEVAKGAVACIPYSLETLVYRADTAEVSIGGRTAPGQVIRDRAGDDVQSTAFLALSETWYR